MKYNRNDLVIKKYEADLINIEMIFKIIHVSKVLKKFPKYELLRRVFAVLHLCFFLVLVGKLSM